MSVTDLREDFGLWERCGNTNFWRELTSPDYRKVLVNPVDALVIIGQEHPIPGGPAMKVWVRDAYNATQADILHSYENNYPWVESIMTEFAGALQAIDAGVVHVTPTHFFQKYYKDQTKEYKETGKGHSEDIGKDELLEAVKRMIVALGKRYVALEKVILRDEWSEFLEDYGILEC